MPGTQPGQLPPPLDLTFPPDPAQLAPVRATLRTWLSRCGVNRRAAADVLIASGEACTNAIEHGLRQTHGHVRLTAEASVNWLRLTVKDTGRWQPPRPRHADPYRGHGLRLMHALMNRVDIDRRADGTTVQMQRRIG